MNVLWITIGLLLAAAVLLGVIRMVIGPSILDRALSVDVLLASTLTGIYAIRYDKAPEFCAHTVILSTLLFAATLPIIISVGQRIL